MRKDAEQLRQETNEALNRHEAHYYGTDANGKPRSHRMTDQEILAELGFDLIASK